MRRAWALRDAHAAAIERRPWTATRSRSTIRVGTMFELSSNSISRSPERQHRLSTFTRSTCRSCSTPRSRSSASASTESCSGLGPSRNSILSTPRSSRCTRRRTPGGKVSGGRSSRTCSPLQRRRGHRRVSLETGTTDAFEPARRLYGDAGFEPCEPFGSYSEIGSSFFMTRLL